MATRSTVTRYAWPVRHIDPPISVPPDAAVSISEAHQVAEVITGLRRAFRASIRSDSSSDALPMAKVELLQALEESPEARVSDLAARLRLAQSTVSTLIGQLMDAGMVDRATDATDRRAARVSLSPAGKRQLCNWEHALDQRITAALVGMSPEDQEIISEALPALNRLAERITEIDGSFAPPVARRV